jgi:hypothetical protein
MRVWCIAMLLGITGPAAAEPNAEIGAVDLQSSGRSVTVELLDVPRTSCATPCVLRAPSGAHRARVDGLARTIIVGDSAATPSRVTIQPTRRARLYAGIAAITAGALGLTLAGHWASPLDDRARLQAGIGGALLFGLAIPLVRSSSAVVEQASAGATHHQPRPSSAEVLAGIGAAGDAMFAGTGFGYRLADSSWGVAARGRFARDGYQVLGGATLYAPRLPLVQPALTVAAGAAVRDGAAAGLLEAEAQLGREVPWDIKPRAAVVADYSGGDVAFAWEAGLVARF